MSICKKPDTKLYNLNTIYFDFETAEYQHESGLISHRPYYNHITHFKQSKIVNEVTFQDYDSEASSFEPDVAKSTYELILEAIRDYEKEVQMYKKTNDKVLISDCLKRFVRLVSFNGAGFDLYFLLQKILQTDGFATMYQIKNIFKGNKLVQFTIYSIETHCVVL